MSTNKIVGIDFGIENKYDILGTDVMFNAKIKAEEMKVLKEFDLVMWDGAGRSESKSTLIDVITDVIDTTERDDAVIGEYTTNKRDEILKAVVEKDLLPNFAITKLDTYIELGTLYIVGTLKNTSKTTKQKIQLRARLLDENKRELRSEKGTLRSIDKILYPNESSLFEIPFKNPPTTITSYRVEVDSWE